MKRWMAVLVAVWLLAAACTEATEKPGAELGDPGDCTVLDMAVSPEKIDLITDLAKSFNNSDAARQGDACLVVRPQKKSSGAAPQHRYGNWDVSIEGPRPVIW